MNPCEENKTRFTFFWPLCLMAVSLAAFLAWQLKGAEQQCADLQQLVDQQAFLAVKSVQAERKFQGMLSDLLELAKSDPDARSLVEKYSIQFNPTSSSSSVVVQATASGIWTDDLLPRK